jgi:hypothetical protein
MGGASLCPEVISLLEHLSHQLQRFSADDPYERCGLIIIRGGKFSFIELPNRHPEPWHKYRMHTRDAAGALRKARGTLKGALHTHPGRTRESMVPTPQDRSQAAARPGLLHMLYHPFTRRLTLFGDKGSYKSFHLKARWVYKKGKF